MSYTDTVLTCRDCGEQFTWTPGEQEFYAKQGLQNPPARCNPCRATRKEAQAEQARERRGAPGGRPGNGRPGGPGGPGNGRDYRPAFANSPGFGGPRGGHGPGSGDGRRDAAPAGNRPYGDRPPRQLFDVVCAECGTPTQVPFLPRGDRPVYCRACFDKRRGF